MGSGGVDSETLVLEVWRNGMTLERAVGSGDCSQWEVEHGYADGTMSMGSERDGEGMGEEVYGRAQSRKKEGWTLK